MLDAFRKASQSWYIKILFGLLILSFGVWGIGDVIRMRVAATPAIVVGRQNISATEVVDEFRRDVERLSAAFGGKLSIDQARQLGLLQRTIAQIVSRSLLDQAADDLKLGVDDDTMRRIIAGTPAFQNQLHVFDKDIYQQVLTRAGLTERQYLGLERADFARQQLVRLIGGGATVPAALAEPLFRYRNEQRVAETVSFPANKMPEPAKPDDATLKAFYKAHSSQFMAPELRAVSAVVIRTADVAGDIKPSEQDVQKAYQARQGEFQTPETRDVQQVLFADKAKAQAFADTVRKGKDFAAAAKATGHTVSDLGWVDRRQMPIEGLAEATFGAPGPGIVGPVQSPLGWHVLHVASVVPGKTRALADVRSIIVQGLVNDEAANRLYALSTKLEDSIGSGAGIEEAAGTVGVKPLKVAAMDAKGDGPDGKPAPGVPLLSDFLATAFQTPQGDTSEVTQFKDNSGYFVLHVDKVTPPAVKPFDTVKDQVIAAWTDDQKEQVSRKEAEAAAERLKKGESLAAVAGPFKVETTKPFLRTGGGVANVPPLLAAEMFKQTAPGGVAVVPLRGGAMLARLQSVIPADPKADAVAYNNARKKLGEALGEDLMQEYLAKLQKDYTVRVNTSLIDDQFQK